MYRICLSSLITTDIEAFVSQVQNRYFVLEALRLTVSSADLSFILLPDSALSYQSSSLFALPIRPIGPYIDNTGYQPSLRKRA